MIYSQKIKNDWTVNIIESSDFKGIVTDEKIVLFSDKEIDIYGLFKIKNNEMIKIHGFHNLRYKIDPIKKIIEFRFIEK